MAKAKAYSLGTTTLHKPPHDCDEKPKHSKNHRSKGEIDPVGLQLYATARN